MIKFSAGFKLVCSVICALTLASGLFAASQADKESAEILYEEALELKKSGKLSNAVSSYYKAMRLDRSVLALDDCGLIEELKKDCETKLKNNPDDEKTLETMGFLQVVCYSDFDKSVEYYQRLLAVVKEENVKERVSLLIERLKEMSKVQNEYSADVSAKMRDERLKSWSEIEKLDRLGKESEKAAQRADELNEVSSLKEDLENRVPQLKQELDEMQEEYDRTDRLYYTHESGELHDMYERRRRRLKNELAAKTSELADAEQALKTAEEKCNALNDAIAAEQQKQNESPIKSYEDYIDHGQNEQYNTKSGSEDFNGTGAPSEAESNEAAEQSANEETTDKNNDAESQEAEQDALEQLINSL